MSDSLKLDISSIIIKNTKTNEVLSPDQYNVSPEGQTLKIKVPDNLPLTITYEAIVQAAPGQAINISNQAHWEGTQPGTNTSVEVQNFSYAAGGTVSTSDTPYVIIDKRNQYNASEKLPGAKFKVTEVELVNGEFVGKSDGQVWDYDNMITGDEGTLTVGREASKLMKWNTVYKIEETEAPEGYVLDETARAPHYFAVAKKEGGSYPTILETYKNAGATIYYLGAEYTYTAYNHKGSVTLTKNFSDANRNNQSKLDGTYKFGLYKVEGEGQKETKIEEKTLSIGHGTTDTTVTFNNLDLNVAYHIYELDDDGNPIQNNKTATVDGKLFDVTYADTDVTLTSQNPTATNVTITNSVHYTELPQTGGMGTTPLYLLGSLLLLIAGGWFICLKRKEII